MSTQSQNLMGGDHIAELQKILSGEDGTKRNMMYVRTSKVLAKDILEENDFFQFGENVKKRYAGIANIEGMYTWITFSSESDFHNIGVLSENLIDQISDEHAKYILKGVFMAEAGEV